MRERKRERERKKERERVRERERVNGRMDERRREGETYETI